MLLRDEMELGQGRGLAPASSGVLLRPPISGLVSPAAHLSLSLCLRMYFDTTTLPSPLYCITLKLQMVRSRRPRAPGVLLFSGETPVATLTALTLTPHNPFPPTPHTNASPLCQNL